MERGKEFFSTSSLHHPLHFNHTFLFFLGENRLMRSLRRPSYLKNFTISWIIQSDSNFLCYRNICRVKFWGNAAMSPILPRKISFFFTAFTRTALACRCKCMPHGNDGRLLWTLLYDLWLFTKDSKRSHNEFRQYSLNRNNYLL